MKKLKYVGYGLLALIAIWLIAALFISKEYEANVELTMDAPKEIIYNLVSNIEDTPLWKHALQPVSDTSVVEGTTNFVNNSYDWNDGHGCSKSYQLIKLATQDSLQFVNHCCGEIESRGRYSFSSTGAKAKINAKYVGRSSYPFNIFKIFHKTKAKGQLAKELESIKQITDLRSRKNIYYGYNINEKIIKDKNFILKRDQVSVDRIQQFYVQNLGVLFQDAQKANLEMDGMPSGLFFNDEEESYRDMAAAIPVSEQVEIEGSTPLYLPAGKVVEVEYYGDYNETGQAHKAIKSYFNDRRMVIARPVIEEYVTDPGDEPDPSKWLTRITYYIEGQ